MTWVTAGILLAIVSVTPVVILVWGLLPLRRRDLWPAPDAATWVVPLGVKRTWIRLPIVTGKVGATWEAMARLACREQVGFGEFDIRNPWPRVPGLGVRTPDHRRGGWTC